MCNSQLFVSQFFTNYAAITILHILYRNWFFHTSVFNKCSQIAFQEDCLFRFLPAMYEYLFSNVPASSSYYSSFYFLPLIYFLFSCLLEVSKSARDEWLGPWFTPFPGISWTCTQPYTCVQPFRSPGICLVLQDFLLNSWSVSCLNWNHSLRQQLDIAGRLL